MNNKKYKIFTFILIGIIVLICSFSIFYINDLQVKNDNLKFSNKVLNELLDYLERSEASLELQLQTQGDLLNQTIMENVDLIKEAENK